MGVIKHSVTTKTFGRHLFALVMLGIEENVLIGDCMTASLPVSKTAGVTFAASLLEGKYLRLRKVEGFAG